MVIVAWQQCWKYIGLACIDGGPFATADGASRVTGTTNSARVMCSSHNVAQVQMLAMEVLEQMGR